MGRQLIVQSTVDGGRSSAVGIDPRFDRRLTTDD
jgi:hypothetical protein